MFIVQHQSKHNSKICLGNLGKCFHIKYKLPGPVSSPSDTLHDLHCHTQRLAMGRKVGLSSTLDTYSSKMENYSTHLHMSHSCHHGNLAYSDSGLTPVHSHLPVQDHSCKLKGKIITK